MHRIGARFFAEDGRGSHARGGTGCDLGTAAEGLFPDTLALARLFADLFLALFLDFLRGCRGIDHLLRQYFLGAGAVDFLVIFAVIGRDGADNRPLFGGNRTQAGPGRPDQGPLDDRWRAVLEQGRDQRLADAQFGNGLLDIQIWVDPERVGRRSDRFLVARGEGAQRMLHPVAELPGNLLRNIDRVLGHEKDADALGPDQPDDLFDLVFQRLWRVVEQQMGLVKEEDQFRLCRIADFRQRFEQFGKQPEQKGRIEFRAAHQLVGGEYIDIAAALIVAFDEIIDLQRRFTKKLAGALAVELQQLALDRADAGLGDIAIFGGQLLCIFRRIGEHRLQIVEVEQQQSFLVGKAEDDVEHAFLGLVQIHQTRQQQRTHFRDRGADGMALLAIEVPEYRWVVGIGIIAHPQFPGPFFQLVGMFELRGPGHRYPGEVAFYIGNEHRHAIGGEAFGQALQGDGLAGPGRSGDQAMPVGTGQIEALPLAAAQSQEYICCIGHWRIPPPFDPLFMCLTQKKGQRQAPAFFCYICLAATICPADGPQQIAGRVRRDGFAAAPLPGPTFSHG